MTLPSDDCGKCSALKKEMDILKRASDNFLLLKERIISTDDIIRRYQSKLAESANRSQQINDLRKQIDILKLKCDSAEEQLRSFLHLNEEHEKDKKNFENHIKQLTDLLDQTTEKLNMEKASTVILQEQLVGKNELMNKAELFDSKYRALELKLEKCASERDEALGEAANAKRLLKIAEEKLRRCDDLVTERTSIMQTEHDGNADSSFILPSDDVLQEVTSKKIFDKDNEMSPFKTTRSETKTGKVSKKSAGPKPSPTLPETKTGKSVKKSSEEKQSPSTKSRKRGRKNPERATTASDWFGSIESRQDQNSPYVKNSNAFISDSEDESNIETVKFSEGAKRTRLESSPRPSQRADNLTSAQESNLPDFDTLLNNVSSLGSDIFEGLPADPLITSTQVRDANPERTHVKSTFQDAVHSIGVVRTPSLSTVSKNNEQNDAPRITGKKKTIPSDTTVKKIEVSASALFGLSDISDSSESESDSRKDLPDKVSGNSKTSVSPKPVVSSGIPLKSQTETRANPESSLSLLSSTKQVGKSSVDSSKDSNVRRPDPGNRTSAASIFRNRRQNNLPTMNIVEKEKELSKETASAKPNEITLVRQSDKNILPSMKETSKPVRDSNLALATADTGENIPLIESPSPQKALGKSSQENVDVLRAEIVPSPKETAMEDNNKSESMLSKSIQSNPITDNLLDGFEEITAFSEVIGALESTVEQKEKSVDLSNSSSSSNDVIIVSVTKPVLTNIPAENIKKEVDEKFHSHQSNEETESANTSAGLEITLVEPVKEITALVEEASRVQEGYTEKLTEQSNNQELEPEKGEGSAVTNCEYDDVRLAEPVCDDMADTVVSLLEDVDLSESMQEKLNEEVKQLVRSMVDNVIDLAVTLPLSIDNAMSEKGIESKRSETDSIFSSPTALVVADTSDEEVIFEQILVESDEPSGILSNQDKEMKETAKEPLKVLKPSPARTTKRQNDVSFSDIDSLASSPRAFVIDEPEPEEEQPLSIVDDQPCEDKQAEEIEEGEITDDDEEEVADLKIDDRPESSPPSENVAAKISPKRVKFSPVPSVKEIVDEVSFFDPLSPVREIRRPQPPFGMLTPSEAMLPPALPNLPPLVRQLSVEEILNKTKLPLFLEPLPEDISGGQFKKPAAPQQKGVKPKPKPKTARAVSGTTSTLGIVRSRGRTAPYSGKPATVPQQHGPSQ